MMARLAVHGAGNDIATIFETEGLISSRQIVLKVMGGRSESSTNLDCCFEVQARHNLNIDVSLVLHSVKGGIRSMHSL